MLLQVDESYYYIYKFSLNKSIKTSVMEPKFVCDLNPIKPHLLKNPYLLPCGKSACLDCIYENYNTFLQVFKCYNQKCQENHQISNKLKEDIEKSESIKQNTKNIIYSLIKNGNNLVDKEKGI